MEHIVRRVEGSVDVRQTEDSLPVVPRRAEGMTVTSQKTLGADPGIFLTWNVWPLYRAKGYRLLGFRSTSGFAPEQYPENLAAHGQLILEEAAHGTLDDRLPEGTYFYTFVLHKRSWLGLRESLSVVRFSESIPSVRTAIGRIEDRLKLQQLQEDCKLREVRSKIAANEAQVALHRSEQKLAELLTSKRDGSLEAQVRREVEEVVRRKLKKAMTRVELLVALQDVQRQLKRSPAWKKLDPKQRESLLEDVIKDLDAGEEFFQA